MSTGGVSEGRPVAGHTYGEVVAVFVLGLDLFADVAVWDAQVLSDIAAVAHQGHVAFGDVDQLESEDILENG